MLFRSLKSVLILLYLHDTFKYENIQKYRVARGELKQTIDDYNKILSLFIKNATIKQLKDILKEKNIEEIPIEKKELQLKVSYLLQKEFK